MDFAQRISLSRMVMAEKHAFFGTLCYYAEVQVSARAGTAWTDGRRIWFNGEFADYLTEPQFMGVLMHEVLHCALAHPARREDRDPQVYNVAADIVVNGMLDEAGCQLPCGCVRYPPWEKFSAEEVYALLQKHCPPELQAFLKGGTGDLVYVDGSGDARALKAYWEIAGHNAAAQARIQGALGAEWQRLFSRLTAPQIDWRTRLWEFMVRTPCDYTGWDRRFIHCGTYLDALDGESCEVNICCDTSGSVEEEELGLFLTEVQAILATYPGIRAQLFYADCELEGPFDMGPESDVPTPVGGGGTSFVPFFDRMEQDHPDTGNACAIYLTDGYGDFPKAAPSIPTLWVIAPGGIEDTAIPFGAVTRLLES